MKKYSIVIPTYNHCNDLLKPCVDSILTYSNIDDIELVISANGCTDWTKQYLTDLAPTLPSNALKVVWDDKPLGYALATNRGIEVATGEKIVLLNNDVVVLPQPKNQWLEQLSSPFAIYPQCGISCVVKTFSEIVNRHFAIFFCVMIDRKVFDKIGLLNTEYGVGAGEDIEFSIEAENAGFEIHSCIATRWDISARTNTGSLAIYHRGEGTVHDPTLVPNWKQIFDNNMLRVAKKYNKPWYEAHKGNSQ